MENRDCFAYCLDSYKALDTLVCQSGQCPFYKTDVQLKEEAEQADARIKRLYGTSLKNFLKLKRSVQK